jgi:hypothetical protein
VCPPSDSDLIFVLAGRQARTLFGLELLSRRVPTIRLSTARFEIRRFAGPPLPEPFDLLGLAFHVPPRYRHFFVLFENRKTLPN